jgi:hypothetical protein
VTWNGRQAGEPFLRLEREHILIGRQSKKNIGKNIEKND